jgi:hypothetical protein
MTPPIPPEKLARHLFSTGLVLLWLEYWEFFPTILQPDLLTMRHWEALPDLTLRNYPLFLALWAFVTTGWIIGSKKIRLASSACLIVIFLYLLFWDYRTYTNHLYLFLLLTIYWIGIDFASSSSQRLFFRLISQTQLTIVYLFAALSKVNLPFLAGSVLYNLYWDVSWVPSFLIEPPFSIVLALGVIIAELFLAIAFWFQRHRGTAVFIGIGLHLTMILLMGWPLWGFAAFAFACWSVYPLFFIRPENNKTPLHR